MPPFLPIAKDGTAAATITATGVFADIWNLEVGSGKTKQGSGGMVDGLIHLPLTTPTLHDAQRERCFDVAGWHAAGRGPEPPRHGEQQAPNFCFHQPGGPGGRAGRVRGRHPRHTPPGDGHHAAGGERAARARRDLRADRHAGGTERTASGVRGHERGVAVPTVRGRSEFSRAFHLEPSTRKCL